MPRSHPLRAIVVATLSAASLLTLPAASSAAVVTFNSAGTDITVTRDDWLAAAGIVAPQYVVDFESGFVDGQNISGIGGLFAGGLVIRDTSVANSVTVEADAGGLGGSNPVGGFAIEHNETPYLVLDFSAAPVDYVAFRDIDHAGTQIRISFVGGGSTLTAIETTGAGGDSAEFVGVFRNDLPRITHLELDASGDGTWGIDDIEYGANAVPLPAAAWLLGGALATLCAARRRDPVTHGTRRGGRA
ncbi:MAG: VPLPA-CTERM sorting domain-containing protein [Gammaproteobacteria bacterium]